MVTIFANMRINSADRLQNFRNSFLSFYTISDNWVVNIRGKMREEALKFLREQLGDKLVEFELLDESHGWSHNALEMCKKIKYEYVLVWNEDHINLAPQEIYVDIIKDMKEENIDFMFYTWWFFGEFRKPFEHFGLIKKREIDALEITPEIWKDLQKQGFSDYVISLTGIFHKDLWKRLLIDDTKKWPIAIGKSICKILHIPSYFGFPVNEFMKMRAINRYVFRDKLPIYEIQTPFNLEKEPHRTDFLPLKVGVPRRELFACIDKDNHCKNYSLIARGMYSPFLSIDNNIKNILAEINTILADIKKEQVDLFFKEIIGAKKIVTAGAGRVGMAVEGFAMRLGHMGLRVHNVGDSNVPSIGEGDLLLVASGSGETQTIYDLVETAKKNKSRVALVTGNKNSRMGKLADVIVELKAPSKTKAVDSFLSTQPMTTLNEQCLSIFFDAMVLLLMTQLGETQHTMWARHSNLE